MKISKSTLIAAGCAIAAAIISTILSVGIIRLCLGSSVSVPLSPRSFICGNDLSAGRVGFKRLTPKEIFIESAIFESKEYSIDAGKDAEKMIDGDKRTLAAPANRMLDYMLKLTEPYRVRQVIITWEDYGTIAKYISQWKLEASTDGTTWKTIEEGGAPNKKETTINKSFDASALRLTAQSAEEWIGVYELEIVGRPL